MKNNLIIGSISGNYNISDVQNWIETSVFDNTERILILYNNNQELESYIKHHNISVIKPNFDFWGQEKNHFSTDTGKMDLVNSYDLIHNVRFFHIWNYLQENVYNKILITDVRDVYFNGDPFPFLDDSKLTATSEMITYTSEEWNKQHLYENLGVIGLTQMLSCQVFNVGVFGGPYDLVKNICADIYLMSVGKSKVADQTSFNYLIQTKYKYLTTFSLLEDEFAVHLHVVNAGLVPFNLDDIKKYKIVHQYDRIPNFKR
jgi:hypothetical protein